MLELHDVILKPLKQTVSLTVSDGQLACISGPKGAGKTTLLRAILGLLPIEGGHISYDGELLSPLSASYFRRFMSYVPSRLVPLPGQDRICDVLAPLQPSSGKSPLRFLWEVPQVDEKGTAPWSSLTLQQQYLELLRMVAVRQRRLVLIDEPAAELDWDSHAEFMNLLRQLTDGGSAVLVVSNLPSVLGMTDNVVNLED